MPFRYHLDKSVSDSIPSNARQGCVPSDNTPPVEPPAEQGIPEQGQQPGHQQGNDEQGVGLPLPPDKETEQSLGRSLQDGEQRQPSYQQGDDGQGYGLSSPIATGGQASEVISREEFSIQEPAACQLVNGQQQPPRYLQCAQANGMSYSTQEMGQDPSKRWGGQEVRHPIQETVLFAERAPDEHDDLPPCHQQLNGTDINGVSSTGEREQAVEHTCSRQELQLWKQKLDRTEPQKATRNKMNPRETFFILEIPEVQQRREAVVNGELIPFFSPAIHTDSYEYKLGIRVYLNGVENESGRYMSIYVNMMMGKFDNIEVRWPFTKRITLSILDQSGAKHHISQSMQAKPNLLAFQKPTEAISCTGCGFEKFASIEEVFSPHDQYVKGDKLFLKIEFCN